MPREAPCGSKEAVGGSPAPGLVGSREAWAPGGSGLQTPTIYEEEVPVFMRRRGCSLCVHITSADDEEEVFDANSKPCAASLPVSILLSLA